MLLNEQRKRIIELEKGATKDDVPEIKEIRTLALSIRNGISDMMPSAGGGYAIETHMLSRGLTEIVNSCDNLIKTLEAE